MKKLITITAAALCAAVSLATAATEADIVANEKATWEAWKNKDEAAFGKLVAADFREVMAEGVRTLAASMTSMKKTDLASYAMSDTKVVFPDPDTAVITYVVTIKGTSEGKPFSGTYNAGAVWRKMGADWKSVLYSEAEQEDETDAQKKEDA